MKGSTSKRASGKSAPAKSEAPQTDPPPTPVAREAAEALASVLSRVIGELAATRHELWRREAELATAIPVAAQPDEATQIARRLEATLQASAEGIGCHAAGLYLLDDGTSELKLRAMWGLPPKRLLAPPRPLRGALADLEALSGHAVALENTARLPQWQTPEPFPAACCVPVSSPTQILGTLWVFSRRHRDFTPQQTTVVELAAQRIAAELERDVLLREQRETRRAAQQLLLEPQQLTAEPLHGSTQLPWIGRVPPILDGWDFLAWTQPGAGRQLSWCDWAELDGATLSLVVAETSGPTGSLVNTAQGAAVAAALAAHRAYPHDARGLLSRLNETLYSAWSGGEQGALLYARLQLQHGSLEIAGGGDGGAIVVTGAGHDALMAPAAPLGIDSHWRGAQQLRTLGVGESLLLFSPEVRRVLSRGTASAEQLLAMAIAPLKHASPERVLASLAELTQPLGEAASRSMLFVRRK